MSAVPPFELHIPEPAPRALSEPNCTACFVSLLLEENTCLKVIAWALTFFISLILCVSLVGIPLVLMGASEYARQSLEPLFQIEARKADWYELRTRALIGEIDGRIRADQERLAVIDQTLSSIEAESKKNEEVRQKQLEEIQRKYEEDLAAPVTPYTPTTPISKRSSIASLERAALSPAQLQDLIKKALAETPPPKAQHSGFKAAHKATPIKLVSPKPQNGN